MNIDKSKLKIGTWYIDDNGNVCKFNEYVRPNDKYSTYHICYPLDIHEKIRGVYNNKDTCKHPLRYRKRTNGWVKGIKGCKCTKCGKEKVGKKFIPFAFMKWNNGADTYDIMTTNHHLCNVDDIILAMANSGEYTLSEALVVFSCACERCMNVLEYKYTNGKDGYAEYSEQWEEANTICDFCKEN